MARTTRRTKATDRWLRSSGVAEVLGCTRQHVTRLTRNAAQETDPTRALLAERLPLGTRGFYRYRESDVLAFKNGPVYAGGHQDPAASAA